MSEDEILDIFFDGTEQQINRPKKGQGKLYSGKKKKHTIKHQVIVSKIKKEKDKKTKLRIKAVSKSFYGKTHDKKIYEKSRTRPPNNVGKYGDNAYLGTVLKIPRKKSKKKELAKEQKEFNQIHSSMIVCVENGIGKMKIWQILSQRFRNRLKDHMIIFKNIAGLQNMIFG
ncbi:MAG: transposase family protein [Patescibacteria group bacterium]|nr:transposase family protein [Patescibacteria group bacterium]